MCLAMIGWFAVPAAVVGLAYVLIVECVHRARIRRAVEERGGELIRSNMQWRYGRQSSGREYAVHYRDAEGHLRRAVCLASLWGGVHLSHHTYAVRRDSPAQPAVRLIEGLKAENARLRNELEQHRAPPEAPPEPLLQVEAEPLLPPSKPAAEGGP